MKFVASNGWVFSVLLSLLACAPSHANARLDLTTAAVQNQNGDGDDVSGNTLSAELELFHAAEVSLREALTIASRLHAGSRVVDISFDGASGAPIYRVKKFQGDHIWEDAIDAKTGQITGKKIARLMPMACLSGSR